jgi:hypothetical protein
VFVVFGGLQFGVLFAWDALRGLDPTARWGASLEWWAVLFQYSAHMTLVLWVPNHVLPAWLTTLLLLRHARRAEFYAGAVMPLAAAMFWGPISAAGAAVLYAVGWARLVGSAADRAVALCAAVSLRNLVAALMLALPAAAYVLTGSRQIPSGFLFHLHPVGMATEDYAALLLVEVLPWAALVSVVLRSGFVLGSTAMLCLLPLYMFGPADEMTMRGGIAPLTVLAVSVGIALTLPRLPGGSTARRRATRIALAACLAISTANALNEASPIVLLPAWPLSRQCALPEAARQSVFQGTVWSHYFVLWPSRLARHWLATPRERLIETDNVGPCWPPDTGVRLP